MSRFSVLEKLADGAAIELFLGKANDTGARLVLEALRLELSGNSEVLRRIHTEAKLRESLQHPGLARRSHAFRSSLGRHFWISEPVSGETLRKYLNSDHKLAPKDAIRFILPLCEAVSYLHQRGLTHGCISPEYILLDGSGTNLRGKILDTGLSLLRVSDRALKSPPGRVIVRPEYLSPERIRGTRGTSSSDIYSLGVLLYELICGVPPYRDTDPSQTRQKHLTAPLPRLPAGAEFLEPVLNGCLAKVPSARFDSVEALHHALVKAESATPLPRGASALVAPAPLLPVTPSSHAPQQLGTYDVLKRLGEGATGQVYLGRHRRIDRHVAIKMLRGEHAQNKEMVARFFQEARAANKVQHPHIAEVYDCVDETTLDGVPQCYLVMEYLEGTTLGQLIRKEPLPLVRAVTLARQICSALEAVHRAGVVHRDIKPDNIFVVAREGKDWVKLVDFGIAKLSWDAEAEGEGRLTAHGEMLGTPSYMAPEQLSAKDVDARADIYAVGTVLYRILAGKLPFDGKSIGEVLIALIRSPPPPLPPTTASGEPLPPELRHLVMRCLEKSPAKRPSSMAELSQLLAPFERPFVAASDDEPISTSGFEIIDDLSESMDQSDEELLFSDVEIDSPSTPPRPPRIPLEGHYFARRAATAFAKTEPNEVVMFVPTEDKLEAGTRVKLRVTFGDCNEAFELDGTLKSGSVTIGPAKLRGIYVSFEREQKVRAEAVLAFCNGKPIAGGILASPRIDVKIPCRMMVGAAKYEGWVVDLSRTGAFITTGTLNGLNPGTKVEVQLEPGPGPQAVGLRTLQGAVVWRGHKNGTPGFAVRFLTSPTGSSAVLNHYLGRIA